MRVGIATFTAVAVGTACLWGSGQGAALFPALAKVMQVGRATEAASAEPPAQNEAPASAPAPGNQVYYQYVDDSGSVQFAARLEHVPAAWRDRAGRVEMSGPPPSRPSEARDAREVRVRRARAAAGAASNADESLTQAGLGRDVVVYGTESCVACKMVRAHLMRRGIRYEDRDVERDPEFLREFLTKSGGRPGVPLVDVGGQIMQGYDSARLDAMLDAR